MSDDSGNELDWLPYKERPEWSDVTPVKEDDGDNPVVLIAYSPKCTYNPNRMEQKTSY